MLINFYIDYRTVYGEELTLCLHHGQTVRMNTSDGQHWHCVLQAQQLPTVVDYHYAVERGGVEVRHEWKVLPHRLELTATNASTYSVYDHWTDQPEDAYLYTSAWTECIVQCDVKPMPKSNFNRTLRLVVRAPQLRVGQRLLLVGAAPALGGWSVEHALPMVQHSMHEWAVDVSMDSLSGAATECKVVAVSNDGMSPLWETGNNRIVPLPTLSDGQVAVEHLGQAFFALPNVRLAGTLIPVFSLRTKGSFGVGDFGDLRVMVDYVAKTGQRVLQVLPICDTTHTHTWKDSYPYSCISVFALHPQFVDLRQLPPLQHTANRRRFAALQEELNALPEVDYDRVNEAKIEYLRLLFAQQGKEVLQSANCQQWMKEQAEWLVPYARFCTLRDRYHTADFGQWPATEQQWHEEQRTTLMAEGADGREEMDFWCYVQWLLHSQMQAVHQHARKCGIILKGDIPIGVGRHSCDVWMEPQYFRLNAQAGAPPDDFSVDGQNWSFPTYNWERMLADGCRWWVRRFQYMAHYFDAYRIDHVLGFFRIWEIPIACVHGLLGQFHPALSLSREEIMASGLPWLEEQFTRPFISDWVLERVFGARADEVRRRFLLHDHDDLYRLAPHCDTERKVEALFAHEDDPAELALRNGLYALINDVLFVRDVEDDQRFHPRIAAQHGFTYQALWEHDKRAFDRLYDDYFYRRNNHFWYNEAMKKLPRLVEATRMLVCAEDLGMVPDCVNWVMQELRILSLEVQSMPKDPSQRFGQLGQFPYRSVCTFSSHDMPTLRQWWDEDEARTQAYYNNELHHEGTAPHPLPFTLAAEVVQAQLNCPSMLCVLSLQDWVAADPQLRREDASAERINIPANPNHYWRYRMHLNVEDMMGEERHVQMMKRMVRNSGR